MTKNKELHPRSETAMIYVPGKLGGKGLISCQAYVWGEENNLDSCVGNCNEVLLRKVGERGTVKTNEAKEPREYKNAKQQIEREGNAWAVYLKLDGSGLRENIAVDTEGRPQRM